MNPQAHEVVARGVQARGRALDLSSASPSWSSTAICFPGPGLTIRVPGEVTRAKLDILRKADAVFIEEARRWSLRSNLAGHAVQPSKRRRRLRSTAFQFRRGR